MKGLLIKDFKLMKMQKNFFLMMIAIVIAISFFQNEMSFPLGFLPFVISLFSLSTISYDEFDNGNAFLFSLPITRKDYVKEKYLLSFLLGFASLSFGILITCVAGFLKGDTIPADIIWAALIILSSLIIIQAIMLPFQLKYGPEKARIALMGTFGLIFAAGVIFVKFTQAAGVGTVILAKLSALHVGIFAAAITLIAAIFLVYAGCHKNSREKRILTITKDHTLLTPYRCRHHPRMQSHSLHAFSHSHRHCP